LLAYLIARFADIFISGKAEYLSASDWRTYWFWVEITILGIIPLVILFWPGIRFTQAGQWGFAAFGVTGIALNRINVGGFVHLSHGGQFYFPAWSEVAISAGVVAVMALVFLFIVERFNIWERRPTDPADDPLGKPEFDPASAGWLGSSAAVVRITRSLAFIIFASIGFALLAQPKVEGRGISDVEAHRARGSDTLWIDGNRDAYGVAFAHKAHISREGDSTSCIKCHHFDLPGDKGTSCAECHRGMYLARAEYRHEWHSLPSGANLGCFDCHEAGKPKSKSSAKGCRECHRNLTESSAIVVSDFGEAGYVDALHQTCTGCHKMRSVDLNREELPKCAVCHNAVTQPSEHPGTLVGRRAIIPSLGEPVLSGKN